MQTMRTELDSFTGERGLPPDFPGSPPSAVATLSEADSQQPMEPNSGKPAGKDIPPQTKHTASRLVAFLRSVIVKFLRLERKQASAPFPSRPIYPGRPGEITNRLNTLEKRLHDLGSRPAAGLVESLKAATSVESKSLYKTCEISFGVVEAFIQQIEKGLTYVNRQVDFGGLAIMAEYQSVRKDRAGKRPDGLGRVDSASENPSDTTERALGLRQLKDQTDSLNSLSALLPKRMKDLQKDWQSP